MKYHLITYGCQMNTADSEEMAKPLDERGFLATSDIAQADIVLMNTCTVREHAEHKALSNLGRLRRWKQENPDRILIVAGCAASLWGEFLKKKYPYVDLVSSATQIDQFPEAIARVLKERWNWEGETRDAFDRNQRTEDGRQKTETDVAVLRPLSSVLSPSLFGNEVTAYITIMRGCNLNCSYCIVPQVRGREQYRPMPEILDEIRAKVAEGHREVMLLGQTVNSYYYRKDRVYDFADLLRAVDALEGVQRIRFLSPHPKHMRDGVIRAMSECSKVARHVHLPAQSGSDRLLERMKRLYSREEYIRTVQKLRAAIPGIAITTDVIVGYPGETAADFERTLSLVEEVRFNGLFAFKYSTRPGTDSARQIDDVPENVKEERLQKVLALNLNINTAKAARPMAKI
jgi:tRNA-2-methylthio-N6-dimethylallyladenosine synthase